ncbi:MAG: GatB/YqeY domain-containing protein [Candidatus Kapaibacterium sp.]|nr:GatB/YqeY domain-containing protein [Ignavibacteriota bacterium]MCB9220896.1 GatB/YqeY domain-containing protein [Ignavibacteria bacterium]
MNLEEKITSEMKVALKGGMKQRLETLRSIKALILEYQKSGKGTEITDEVATKLLNKAAKNRKDSIALYLQAGRTELAEKEKQELEIIREFMPKQLSEEELNTLILSIIKKLNVKELSDMGKVMGATMQEINGKADGNTVQQIVRKLLSNN